jgi:hypothetical protein
MKLAEKLATIVDPVFDGRTVDLGVCMRQHWWLESLRLSTNEDGDDWQDWRTASIEMARMWLL